MKILVIIPSYKPAYIYGGPTRCVAALCESLVRRGHEVDVYTTNANGPDNLLVTTKKPTNVDGVTVIYFPRSTRSKATFSLSFLRLLWRQIHDYEIIHIHSWWNLIVYPAVVICKWKGIRPILSPHGMLTVYTFSHNFKWFKRIFHTLFGKKLLEKCFIHVSSNQEIIDMKHLINVKKAYIIPNILELPTAIYRSRLAAGSFKLIYLGRIEAKKNIEFLLDVLCHQFDIPFELKIIGDGDPAYMEKLKIQTRTFSQIQWMGAIYNDSKWQYLADADLLLLPSFNENFAIVVIEGLSQGTPALVSDRVGLKDYLIEQDLGWVAPLNADNWRKQLLGIWLDQAGLKRIRDKAPRQVNIDFNPDTLVSKYEAMYDEVSKTNT